MSEEAPTLPTPNSAAPAALEEAAPEGILEERLKAALGEQYELGAQIGRGGMGIVFRAMDRRLKREVAIKVLPPEVTYRADLRKRFVREAQVAASLTHPNIVPIYDVGNKEGLVWFVMAFIYGESARDLVRRSGPQAVHVTLRVLRETAWALSYAHARGVIHRDVKPDNIMIERGSGRTIVTDFGLAKIRAEEGTALTSAGGVVGTPAYMSPEQARGSDGIDNRTDIYSLGLVGYYLLTARNPFEAKGQQAVLARVLTEEAPNVANVRPELAPWLVDVLGKATRRDPARRYEQAEALANDLDQGETPSVVPTSVENLLDLLESYIELSILGAWVLFIFGVPELPTGGSVLLLSLLCFPLLRAIRLVTAEGLRWPDVRNGITIRRTHWLRTRSLEQQAGFNFLPFLTVLLSAVGVALLWFFRNFDLTWSDIMGVRLPTFTPVAAYKELFPERPDWGFFWYAILGSILWARLFGLPRARRLSPWQLDAVSSWRLPRALDWFGRILMIPITTLHRKIEATSDFRQLSDPAIQAALAFNRTRRNLPWGARWRMRGPIKQGCMIVRRLWYTQERLAKFRARSKELAEEPEKAAALAGPIAQRENLLAECSASLDNLRMILEEAGSPIGAEATIDYRALEEARRLTLPMRRLSRFTKTYLLLLLAWAALIVVSSLDLSGASLRFKPPELGTLGRVIEVAFDVTLPLFILFQFVKRRIYT